MPLRSNHGEVLLANAFFLPAQKLHPKKLFPIAYTNRYLSGGHIISELFVKAFNDLIKWIVTQL